MLQKMCSSETCIEHDAEEDDSDVEVLHQDLDEEETLTIFPLSVTLRSKNNKLANL